MVIANQRPITEAILKVREDRDARPPDRMADRLGKRPKDLPLQPLAVLEGETGLCDCGRFSRNYQNMMERDGARAAFGTIFYRKDPQSIGMEMMVIDRLRSVHEE